ncbi:UNVERIFIED_CONTAM: hypothetical protein FKN15_002377 [Acipenser sinensis]
MWQSRIGGKTIALAKQGGVAEGTKGGVAEGTKGGVAKAFSFVVFIFVYNGYAGHPSPFVYQINESKA